MSDDVAGPDGAGVSEGLGRASEALHVAVCQAVALLNRAPEVARCAEGREVRELLRQALTDYADAYMDAPVAERERATVAANVTRKRDDPTQPGVQRLRLTGSRLE